jgi:hypothetical protein
MLKQKLKEKEAELEKSIASLKAKEALRNESRNLVIVYIIIGWTRITIKIKSP